MMIICVVVTMRKWVWVGVSMHETTRKNKQTKKGEL